MTRRNIHQTIRFGITIVMILTAIGIAVFVERKTSTLFIAYAILVVSYLVVYAILMSLMRRNVPAPLRHRPETPPEFRRIPLGPVTPEIAGFLAGTAITKDHQFRKRRHVLHYWEKPVPEGMWKGYAEVAGGKVVAWGVGFRSVASPVLDFGDSRGEGKFICLPST